MCKNYVKICRETRAIYALLVYVAKTNYALLKQMLREKKPMHFVRKVFARKILPTGKLGLFRPLLPPLASVACFHI